MSDKDNWVSVYTVDALYKAELIKQVLSDNNIIAVVINKKDSFYQFGHIEICVQSINVIRAKHILNNIKL